MIAADRRVEFELERRRLEWLVGRSRSAALGPVGHYIAGSAAPVADAPVKRLDRKAARRVAGDERVEAPGLRSHRFCSERSPPGQCGGRSEEGGSGMMKN